MVTLEQLIGIQLDTRITLPPKNFGFTMQKHTFLLGITFLAMSICPVVSQADTVLVFRGNHLPTSDPGSVAELTSGGSGSETFTLDSSPVDGASSTSFGYTITGFDATSDGTANDTITAVFTTLYYTSRD